MPRKASRIIAIHNESGEHRVFPSIQVASDFIYSDGFAGDNANNMSVNSFITRVSKVGGCAYGFTFMRVPDIDPEKIDDWAEAVGVLAEIRAIAQKTLEGALTPDVTDSLIETRKELAGALEALQVGAFAAVYEADDSTDEPEA